jgi:ferredoxin--NADP+ reductase
VIVDPADLELDADSVRWLEEEGDPTARRNVELLREFAAREPKGYSHRVVLRFLRSPVEILGAGADGAVSGVRVVRNRIERSDDGRLRAVATAEEEVIECGLVLRSIGYRGRPLDDVPFDERTGLIRNTGGRVLDDDGEPIAGEYCVGWIKRGPSGVIGTNKKDAADTVARIVEDAEHGRLPDLDPARSDPEATAEFLLGAGEHVVEWEGWQAIDEHEKRLGEPAGRPRVKLVRMGDLHDAGRGAATPR